MICPILQETRDCKRCILDDKWMPFVKRTTAEAMNKGDIVELEIVMEADGCGLRQTIMHNEELELMTGIPKNAK